VVLANTGSAQALLGALGHPLWPLQQSRGQLGLWPLAQPCALRLPVTGGGYVVQAHGTAAGRAQSYLMSGATDQPLPWGDGPALVAAQRQNRSDAPHDTRHPVLGSSLRSEEHQHNLRRLKDLTGLPAPLAAADGSMQGWAGTRLRSVDRWPIAGQVAGRIAGQVAGQVPGQVAGQTAGQLASWQPLRAGAATATGSGPTSRLQDLPREAGLFVLTALGSRGATYAPLLGRLVAAQVLNRPLPLEADLVDALDPARWQLRATRRG